MSVIGFQVTKLHVERSEYSGNLQVMHNVNITGVKKQDLHFPSPQNDSLKFEFAFTQKYEPKAGSILIEGFIVLLLQSEQAKQVLEMWKKDEKINKDILVQVLQTAYSRSLTQSILLAKEVGLPCPVPFPKLQVDEKNVQKK